MPLKKEKSTMAKTMSEFSVTSKGMVRIALALIGFIVVLSAVMSATNAKFSNLRAAMLDSGLNFVSAADKMRQLECLTKNIYWEAANEPFEGKVAVAQVTLNRVTSGQFAGDVCGVVYERTVVYSKAICQFSWVCENKHRIQPVNQQAYAASEDVAKQVLFEDLRLPSLETALYYHADYVNPKWGKKRVAKIGRHIFYKG